MVKINILTRTGSREKYYKTLKNSIDKQTHTEILHIKSNDNPNCNYLIDEDNVIEVTIQNKSDAFYNLYLNTLIDNVNDGWIIILDDDSIIIDNNFIKNLSDVCEKSNPDEILIYQVYIDRRKRILPPDDNMIKNKFERRKIDMSCFCFHNSISKEFRIGNGFQGDFDFLENIKNSKKYKFKFINLNKGIWANYHDPKMGKN